jgi:hypothetical protein
VGRGRGNPYLSCAALIFQSTCVTKPEVNDLPFAAGGTEFEKVRLFFLQVSEEHVPAHLLGVVWVIFRPSVVFVKDRQSCIFFFLHLWPSSNAAYSSAAVRRKAWGLGTPRQSQFQKRACSAALIKQTTNKYQNKVAASV